MLLKCTYNSHLLLLKFHVISIYHRGTIHVSEAMVIVGGTPELLRAGHGH